MKKIRYQFLADDGIVYPAEMDYSPANEALARQEALNGECSIEEVPDEEMLHNARNDIDAMLIEHEYRLTLLELGLTEMEE